MGGRPSIVPHSVRTYATPNPFDATDVRLLQSIRRWNLSVCIAAVNAERFIAVGITFENSAGPGKYQAMAVRNSGDLSIFYSCSFLGYQDTLYVHSLRQFYRDCDIYGTVDFIFGNAASVFQDCNIYARRPLRGQSNVVTAQGRTMPDQATGISIHNCTVSAAPDLAADRRFARTFLGRPWKDHGR
ncbi:hypothetical protein GW17_00023395 [Ensete ventricosum]|nr:hypothetical protein GW17_00023395 [Ensete ventricosum]